MLFHSIAASSEVPVLSQRLKAALTPVAEHHLDVLLALPPDGFDYPGMRTINEVVEKFLSDEWRDHLIERLPEQPPFASLVRKKGWTQEVWRVLPRLSSNFRRFNQDMCKILLALDEPMAQQRLFEELRRRPQVSVFDGLRSTYPKLIPQLDQIAEENFQKVNPVLQSYEEQPRILIAARQGDEKALDLGIRWVANGGETGAENYHRYVTELGYGLVRLLGLKTEAEMKHLPKEELWPLFRDLRASDFQYLPAERRWEKRPQS